MSIEILKQVGKTETPCVAELLFRDFVAKKISKEDYEIRTAIAVAENIRGYMPRLFPQMPHVLLEYISARLNHVREKRDTTFHKKLGTWTATVRWVMDQNEADRDMLIWMVERLKSKGLAQHVRWIEARLSEYILIEIPKEFEEAMRAQGLDSLEKQREERSR